MYDLFIVEGFIAIILIMWLWICLMFMIALADAMESDD